MILVGIDEVGRGCVAGPVVAAAVAISGKLPFAVYDSKKINANKREQLDILIKEHCLDFAISIVYPQIIDEINIHEASLLAMSEAFNGLIIYPDSVKVDGRFIPGQIDHPNLKSIINGDSIVPEISTASIIAKVFRDNLMDKYARQYPNYHFHKHKGYLTKKHLEAIDNFGACEIHRRSFAPFS
jgi:ribonuclease HII